MTLQQKKNRAYIITAIGATSFGIWQHSLLAFVFMACLLGFFGGLVVAVQHYWRRDSTESLRRAHEMMEGTRCWKCGEKYVGLAMDCKCTNYGRA